jgi:hypothetical protein
MSVKSTGGWGTSRIKKIATCHPDRTHYANHLCRHCYRNTPKHQAARHRYYKRHLARFRRYSKESIARRVKETRAYGISKAEIDQMESQQRGRCAICDKPPKRRRLNIDHDHVTGRVRALLCTSCNGGLGHFKDDPRLLAKAIEYLNGHRDRLRPTPTPSSRP